MARSKEQKYRDLVGTVRGELTVLGETLDDANRKIYLVLGCTCGDIVRMNPRKFLVLNAKCCTKCDRKNSRPKRSAE